MRDLRSLFDSFSMSWHARGGDALDLQVGDALATYVTIFGFEHVRGLTPSLVDAEVGRIWGEFVVTQGEGARAYLEDPAKGHTAPLPKLKNLAKTTMRAKPFRVAFIYDRNPLSSGWIALPRTAGRQKLEMRLGATVSTRVFTDRSSDDAFDQAVSEAADYGADLVVDLLPHADAPGHPRRGRASGAGLPQLLREPLPQRGPRLLRPHVRGQVPARRSGGEPGGATTRWATSPSRRSSRPWQRSTPSPSGPRWWTPT